MSKPLDLIEVMARAFLRARQEMGLSGSALWEHEPANIQAIYIHGARAVLAALEKEGHVVVPRTSVEQAAVHLEIAAATLEKAGRPAAAMSARGDAKEARAMIDARPGISHPQAVYTPEPRKEVRSITIAPGVTLSRSSIQADHPTHKPPLKEES